MKNVMKTATLESKFPLLAVENGCIISKDADITVAYRVELPELFTVTSAEYEAIHSTWYKAIKVLPDYSIVHKQDFFIEENYQPDTERKNLSFLSRSFERHFNERPYLKPLLLPVPDENDKGETAADRATSTLTGGFIIPKEMQDKETAETVHRSGRTVRKDHERQRLCTLTRLTDEEIIGQDGKFRGHHREILSLSQKILPA